MGKIFCRFSVFEETCRHCQLLDSVSPGSHCATAERSAKRNVLQHWKIETPNTCRIGQRVYGVVGNGWRVDVFRSRRPTENLAHSTLVSRCQQRALDVFPLCCAQPKLGHEFFLFIHADVFKVPFRYNDVQACLHCFPCEGL